MADLPSHGNQDAHDQPHMPAEHQDCRPDAPVVQQDGGPRG